MFYHALTGNGGTTPTEDLEPVLLWENSSPTAEFAPQTISLNLTDYAGTIVEFHQNNTQAIGTRAYIKKNDNGITGVGYPDSSSTIGLARPISVTDSGVVFGTGAPNSDNNNCIPYRIYGVKEYVVEPQIGDLLWTNPTPTASFGAQKISVDLSNAKGVIIECMISYNTQMPNIRTLIYKRETQFGIGFTAGTTPTSRNVTAVDDDGVTFATAYSGTAEAATALIPYKIYAIN